MVAGETPSFFARSFAFMVGFFTHPGTGGQRPPQFINLYKVLYPFFGELQEFPGKEKCKKFRPVVVISFQKMWGRLGEKGREGKIPLTREGEMGTMGVEK